jgi:hypothetical protein
MHISNPLVRLLILIILILTPNRIRMPIVNKYKSVS